MVPRTPAPHAHATERDSCLREAVMPLVTVTEPPFGNLVRQMNKMIDQMHKGYYNFAPGETWTPSVNLYENETSYVVCVDLAGVEKEKIDVLIVDGRLKLRGTRSVPMHPDRASDAEPHGKRVRVHLMEIDHGSFCREVELPHDVHPDSVTANYRDGLLWIELPKK
jgi:HSP20 family protein